MKYLYTFWGKVRKGKSRGKKLGFPTANINLKKNIPQGVYISKSKVQGKIFPSLTFIGEVKTFDEHFYHGETYILNFDKSIYKNWVSIKLIKKLRENKKFDSEKDLISQMRKDLKIAEEYFKT